MVTNLEIGKSRLAVSIGFYLLAGLLFSLAISNIVSGKYILAVFNVFVIFTLLDTATYCLNRSVKWIHFFRKYNIFQYIFKTPCWCYECEGTKYKAIYESQIETWQDALQQNDELEAEVGELLDRNLGPGQLPHREDMLHGVKRLREEAVQQIKELREKIDAID